VPPATAVGPSVRRVPARTFLPVGSSGPLAGADHDEGTVFVIMLGTDDTPVDLLDGGEAMSALLLGTIAEGVSTVPSAKPSRWRGPDGCCAGSCPRPVSRT
jgi:hypothetical protein